MRVFLFLVASLVLTLAPLCAQVEEAAEPQACNATETKGCGVKRQALKKARQAFERGNKLKDQAPEKALEEFEEAVRLVPRNVDYLTATELLKQHLAYLYVKQGNALAIENRTVEASREFRKALELDPSNPFAGERLADMGRISAPAPQGYITTADSDETIGVSPKPVRLSFNRFDDTRMAFTTVVSAYGLKVNFDPSTPGRRVKFDVHDVDFYQAMDILCTLTGTFWMPTSPTEITVAADTPTIHRQADRWVLRTFYLPEASTAQDLTDISNLLRTLFELRYVQQHTATFTITVRGPAPAVDAATRLLESMSAGRPQVMLEIDVYQVTRQLLRNIGLDMPLQFSVFNIPAAALAGLAGQNIQQLINQLIASGGINQGSALSALLAQLQNQQSSLFSNPVATFGGGKTLMGIGVPPANLNFSLTDSHVNTLERATLRAAQGNVATFRVGSRYPILSSSYAPVFNTPQISSIIGSGSYVAPFPSFTYEDLGLSFKAKPAIHGTDEVTLDFEMELRVLTGQSFNSVPVISQRSYKGAITVKNDQPAVLAGSISESEQDSLKGIPGAATVPLANYLISNQNKQHTEDELLIVVTPHIIGEATAGATPVISVPRSER